MEKDSEYKTIAVTKEDNILTVTLNRPEKLNALNPQMGMELVGAFGKIASDDSVRVVIITGTGRAFSAGGDAREDIAPLSKMSSLEFNEYFGQLPEIYCKVANMEKPVIAAINGYTIGAGLDLAMSCDIRIASEEAQFGEFFVRMGLVPEAGVYFMPRLLGIGRAKLLSFTGDLIDAKEAERIGLVEKVVPPDKLITSVKELASKLANRRPIKTVGLIKKAINESLRMDLDSSLDYASRLTYQSVHTEDHREAVNAFLEGRRPVFKGR